MPVALRLRQISVVEGARDRGTMARRRDARGCTSTTAPTSAAEPLEGVPGRWHRNRMAATGRAAFWRSYPTSDRNADGETAPAARHHVQQSVGAWRIRSSRHSALTLRDLSATSRSTLSVPTTNQYTAVSASADRGLAGREGEIPLQLPHDRRRFWLTFLPEEERTLRPTGIHLFGLRYWSPALSARRRARPSVACQI